MTARHVILTVTWPVGGGTAWCTNRGTRQTRIGGPHPDRIATAQAALEIDG